jgi:hypothetical protein
MELFESFKACDHTELVQTRKALTEHIFGQVAAGETDEQKLVVAGLTHLKSLERRAEESKPFVDVRQVPPAQLSGPGFDGSTIISL